MSTAKSKKSSKPKIKDLPVSKKKLRADETDAIKGGVLKRPAPIPKPTLPAADIA